MTPKVLAQALALKSDKQDLSALEQQKADKMDTENLADLIRVLNQQIQHTVVLLHKSTSLHLARGQDTGLAKEERALQLIQDAKLLENWAMKFDVNRRVNSFVGCVSGPRSVTEGDELHHAKK